MKKHLLLLTFILSGFNLLAQTNTDEMLSAPNARYYIQLWPDFDKKTFYYTLDKDQNKKLNKSLKSLTVGVPIRDKEVALTMRFYNPLRYSVTTSDTLLTDPSYKAISDFADALTNLIRELPSVPNLTTTSPATPKAGSGQPAPLNGIKNEIASKISPQPGFVIQEAGSFNFKNLLTKNNLIALPILDTDTAQARKWAEIINEIRAEQVAEWKYISTLGNVKCMDANSTIIKQFRELDYRYFNASIRGEMRKYLTQLSLPDDIHEFMKVNKRFKFILDSLDKRNEENIRLLQAFDKAVSEDIAKNLLTTQVSAEPACKDFAVYTQIVFKRFIRARWDFQQKRNQMLELAKKINVEVDKLVKTADELTTPDGNGTLQNAFILNRYDIRTDKMRDVYVSIRKRNLDINSDEPKITDTDDKILGKVRLRAAQTFVPEFAAGAFYTNLRFPVFGTKVVNGETRIDSTSEAYPIGAAGMLNLTLNALKGLAHPVVQLGVGTGKNRPTFLAGFGWRINTQRPIVISGGAVWGWQRALMNNLKVNDRIEGDAALRNNLEYRFNPKPKFYLSLLVDL